MAELLRAGYTCPVRFWEDSDETFQVHWYKVPRDRPVLPVASFVASNYWEQLNGMRSGMLADGIGQGEQFDNRPWDQNPPQTTQNFTGHYCGTADQWAGNLRSDRLRDRGDQFCCIPKGQPVLQALQTTPVTINAVQNNYPLPVQFDGFRLNSSAHVNITGFANGVRNRIVILENIGTFRIKITNNDPNSIAANRVLGSNGQPIWLNPNTATVLKYDSDTQRWREVSTRLEPLDKGDIIVGTNTGPVRLAVGATCKFLHANSLKDEGVEWADLPAFPKERRDLNYFRQSINAPAHGMGGRWYLSSYDFAANLGPGTGVEDKVYLTAFINPGGFHVTQLAVYVTSLVGVGAPECVLAIYQAAADNDQFPGDLIQLQVQSLGLGLNQMDFDQSLDPGLLYFTAMTFTGGGASVAFQGTTTPPTVWYPLYGIDDSFNTSASLTAFVADRTYDSSLPSTWDIDGPFAPDYNRPSVGVRYGDRE